MTTVEFVQNNKSSTIIKTKPFAYFQIKNFLQEDLFQQIKSDIYDVLNTHDEYTVEDSVSPRDKVDLGKISVLGTTKHSNSFSFMKDLFASSQAMNALLDQFTKPSFLKTLPIQLDDRRPIRVRDKHRKISFVDKLCFNNVYISVKLSRYPEGAGIALHRDGYPKLAAFLLYLGWNDSVERTVGGIQFYEKIDDGRPAPEDHSWYANDGFKEIANFPASANSFVGFNKAHNSWHGVNKISGVPNGVTRDALQINIMKCTNYVGMAKIISDLKRFVGQ